MKYDAIDNVTKILGIKPMSISELIDAAPVLKATPTPEKLDKDHLQKMLDLLEITTLERIDSKCRKDAYTFGQQSLLKYSPEGLVEYASAIYRYILPYFDTAGITKDAYIAKYTILHTKCMKLIASKDYMLTLSNIVATPVPAPQGYSLEKDVYNEISAYIDNHKNGADWDCFEGLNDFLTNSHSPLRWDSIYDSRITAMIAEVDNIRNACNKELEAFIGVNPTINDEAHAVSYGLSAPKPKYGTELKHYRNLIQERLDYYTKLNPKRIVTLTAHKAQIPQADWDLISQAIETKIVSKAVGTLITATLKAIKANATPVTLASVDEPVDTFATNELFIQGFVSQLESTYAIPVVKDPEKPTTQELLGDVYNTIDALYTANTQETSINSVQDSQKSSEVWYSAYANIRQSLSACLQISLNKVSPSVVLSEGILNHGAIKGMLTFAKHIHNHNIYAYDYVKLAQELHHQLKTQTNSYTLVAPLPQLVPMTKEQVEQSLESTIQQDTSFNITQYIQPKMNKLRPTTALTECIEVALSADDINALLPIPDHTIVELLSLACGTGTKPYLLKGQLLGHTKHGKYLKIVPHINKDGYASYTFTAINYKSLNYLINKYCELLHAIPAYDDLVGYHRDAGDEFFGIAPEYDYDAAITSVTAKEITTLVDIFTDENVEIADATTAFALATINTLLKSRMQSSKEHLSLVSIPECQKSQSRLYDDDVLLLDCLKIVVERVYDDLKKPYKSPYSKYYDPTYYISSHYLSMWMADPKDYTEKITFGNGEYSVDHILQGVEHRSNNSFDNIRIKTKKFNSGRTSRSIPVIYADKNYNSISDYSTATDAGNADNLEDLKNSLKSGETRSYKGREYTLSADEKQLIATDAVIKATQITFNGKNYGTLKDFAKAMKLDYNSLHNALSDARKKTKMQFKFKKKYTFYLDEAGAISKIL